MQQEIQNIINEVREEKKVETRDNSLGEITPDQQTFV